MHVLFVCTANINRSFMAEVIFKERLKKHGKQDITVSSAALVDMKGEPADPIAAKILMEGGSYDKVEKKFYCHPFGNGFHFTDIQAPDACKCLRPPEELLDLV